MIRQNWCCLARTSAKCLLYSTVTTLLQHGPYKLRAGLPTCIGITQLRITQILTIFAALFERLSWDWLARCAASAAFFLPVNHWACWCCKGSHQHMHANVLWHMNGVLSVSISTTSGLRDDGLAQPASNTTTYQDYHSLTVCAALAVSPVACNKQVVVLCQGVLHVRLQPLRQDRHRHVCSSLLFISASKTAVWPHLAGSRCCPLRRRRCRRSTAGIARSTSCFCQDMSLRRLWAEVSGIRAELAISRRYRRTCSAVQFTRNLRAARSVQPVGCDMLGTRGQA